MDTTDADPGSSRRNSTSYGIREGSGFGVAPRSSVLRVEELSVSLSGELVVEGVSFTVREGGCLGLVGETGCGKSVTCRALGGTLGRIGGSVTRGRIVIEGRDRSGADEREWRLLRGRTIGFVPQASMSALDPVMRIDRQLRETLRVLRPTEDARAVALELLDKVRLVDPRRVARQYPHELSGGMRQRVMIALALAGHPKILGADEPTTALDVTVQREILDLIDALRREMGMAVVLVTHDLDVVRERADEVAVMYAGSVVERGAVADIFSRPTHPYTRALLDARPRLDGVGRRLQALPGSPPPVGHRPRGCAFADRCPLVREQCRERAIDDSIVESSSGVEHVVACLGANEGVP